MFRPVPMVHFQVQVPNRCGALVTRRIADRGLLHLIDISHGHTARVATDGATHDLLARFRDLARTIRRVAVAIQLPLPDPNGALAIGELDDLEALYRDTDDQMRPIQEAADAALRSIESARETIAKHSLRLADAARIENAQVDPARMSRLRFARVRLGVADRPELANLAGLLSPLPFAIIPLEDTARPLAAIACPASAADQVDAILRVGRFEPVAWLDEPDGYDAAGRRAAIAQAESDDKRARESLAAIRETHARLLTVAAGRTDLAVLLLQAQTCFAAAGRFLVIAGWIPEDRAQQLAEELTALTAGRAVISVDKPEALELTAASPLTVPILHRNPILFRPFQQLIEIYGVPSYPEIQPTAFFAVSFLVMFGLMFGDVGHGGVLISAGYFLFRYAPRFLDYAILLMEAGAASATFGVLYGSVFGVELLPVLWLHPINDLPRFMAVAIGLGVVLVSAGILLNVLNNWRAGARADALVGTRGLLGAFMYWTVLLLLARLLLPSTAAMPDALITTLFVGAATLLVAQPIIVGRIGRGRSAPAVSATPRWLGALEGSIELVDAVFAYFTNTVSFVRIAAFASVHAAVFVAMFSLADTLAQFRFGSWLSVAALVAGNALMILLEGLTVTVQTLRLEYYEFFSKFFRGGGERYRPLMLRDGIQGGP